MPTSPRPIPAEILERYGQRVSRDTDGRSPYIERLRRALVGA